VFDLESRGSSFGKRGAAGEGEAAAEAEGPLAPPGLLAPQRSGGGSLDSARSGGGGLGLARQPSGPPPSPHDALLRAMALAHGDMRRAAAGLPLTGEAAGEAAVAAWTRELLGLSSDSAALLALYGEVALARPGVKLADVYDALAHLRCRRGE
jgi:hypothetical protein